MKNVRYAVIDIETTGGLVKRDKITEIGIVLHDGEKVLEQFESLVNPERSIPEYISNLTGITNDMVAGAPRFFEIAKQVVEMTEGAVFVAHNARFDYGFIREEFKRLGYTYTRKQLCTVRLSKRHLPELKSHSLDNLIRHYNIQVKNRHRALDDALAAAEVMQRIFSRQESENSAQSIINAGIRESRLPDNITLQQLHDLPESAGVYYFHNIHGDIIYVGKSKNIRSRVMQHFANITNKAAKLQQKVHDISFTITGSELIALLFENQEIKKHQPEVNRALRRVSFPFVLYACYDLEGYINFKVGRRNKIGSENVTVIREYPEINAARGHMLSIIHNYGLCQNKSDQPTGPGSCFHYKIQKCAGACLGEENPESYNERVQSVIDELNMQIRGNIIIVDEGRSVDEKSLVGIKNGKYYGFGYVDANESLNNLQHLFDHIKQHPASPESLRIIHHFVQKNRAERIIRF